MNRKVVKKVKGYRTVDGAGVNLVRVLGAETVKEYDPILMLDSFDSENYDDYKAGFPTHPHRGIETITYLYKGNITHKDSLLNEDTISDGQVQWMTAGSGIMHSEMLPKSDRILGVQVWLNLPKKDKMAKPSYRALKEDDIKEIEFEGGKIRLLAGDYKENKAYQSNYLPLDFYDIHLDENKKIELEVKEDKSIQLFTLVGKIKVEGQIIEEKTAAKLSKGDELVIENLDEKAQVLFLSSDELKEEVAWGGSIVMNTRDELIQANIDLRSRNFIKEEIDF